MEGELFRTAKNSDWIYPTRSQRTSGEGRKMTKNFFFFDPVNTPGTKTKYLHRLQKVLNGIQRLFSVCFLASSRTIRKQKM